MPASSGLSLHGAMWASMAARISSVMVLSRSWAIRLSWAWTSGWSRMPSVLTPFLRRAGVRFGHGYLLGAVRASGSTDVRPRRVLGRMTPTRRPQATCLAGRHGCPGCAASGQLGEVRVELDAEPVPAELLGGDGGRAAAEERIEHHAGLARRVAVAGRAECAPDGGAADRPNEPALPRRPAAAAAGFRTAGQDGAVGQRQRERGVVGAPVVARGQRPDVAGVLAERVPDDAARLQRVQAGGAVAVRAAPGLARSALEVWSLRGRRCWLVCGTRMASRSKK